MDLGNMLGNMLGGNQNQYNQQGYNQQYNNQQYNNQQYNNQQQYNGYNKQNYNGYNQQQPMQTMNQCTGTFKTHNELFCKCTVGANGSIFAKKGSMVAYEGNLKFSKRLLGTNDGNIVGQVLNHAARKITGENLEIMEIKNVSNTDSIVYLADQGAHCVVIDLEPNGPWNSICVESEDLLAFKNCHYGVTPIGVGVISQKGLFTSKLTYNGPGSQVCIKSNGNPLVLQATPDHHVFVDPDAFIAFAGDSPKFKADVGFKTLIGQTSGESYQLEFSNALVVVQPYERESGISIRDTNRPQMQGKPRMGSNGQSGAFVEDQIGNMLNNIF